MNEARMTTVMLHHFPEGHDLEGVSQAEAHDPSSPFHEDLHT